MRMWARVGRVEGEWCHLFSTASVAELDAFAARIGLRKEWRQNSRGFIHYDVVESRRKRAIALGAVEISYRDLPEYANIVRANCK